MKAWRAAFRNSCAGLSHALRTERAVHQEIVTLAFATPAAFLVGAGPWQRVALIGVLLLLISVELLNTCIEKLCDHVTPDLHPQIKIVKDLGSAAVFVTIVFVALVWLVAAAERLALI